MMRLANFLAWCLIVFVVLSALTLCVFAVMEWTHPRRPISPEDIVVVNGRVERVEKDPVEQLWIEGHGLPFRNLMKRIAADDVPKGEPVEIGILRAEQADPPRNHIRGENFQNVYTLEVGGRTILSLDERNRYIEDNAVAGKLLAPTLALVAILAWRWWCSVRDKPLHKLWEYRQTSRREWIYLGLVLGLLASPLVGLQGWNGEGWAGRQAGSGIGGALLGLACGFGAGACLAGVLAAIGHLVVLSKKYKRTSYALSAALWIGFLIFWKWQTVLIVLVLALLMSAARDVVDRAAREEASRAGDCEGASKPATVAPPGDRNPS